MAVAAQVQKIELSSQCVEEERRDYKLQACAIMETKDIGFLGLWLWSGGDVFSASDFRPKSYQPDLKPCAGLMA